MPTNNLIRQLPMAGRANFLPYQIGADGKPQLALPGILAGAVNAVTAPYRAMNPQDYPDFNTEQEAADFALNMMGGGTVFGRAPKNALGMNVWHGSPHKFEPTELNDLGEFNAAKIGTGEGAQAYSHGHYTGEARGTGEQYADTLGMVGATDKAGNQYGRYELASFFEDALKKKGVAEGAAKSQSLLWADKFIKDGDIPHETAREIINAKALVNQNGGYLYKVDIPDEQIAKMLDWDKPLTTTPNGRAALDGLMPKLDKESAQLLKQDAARLDGSGLVTWAQRVYGKDGASAYLQSHGIPGVRYLDAGSRRAEGGTSNFVVFPGNEHMMTILERNGQAMSPESQAIARYREIKGAKSVVRMEAALRTAGVPLPKNEPVAYIQSLVDRAHRRN